MSSVFTCTACAVVFGDPEDHKAHYKLDWHRHNLHRKVAGLAPLSQSDFDRRLAAALGSKAPKPSFQGRCKECRKSFRSEGLYKQHLKSKKHKDAVRAAVSANTRATTIVAHSGFPPSSPVEAPAPADTGGDAAPISSFPPNTGAATPQPAAAFCTNPTAACEANATWGTVSSCSAGSGRSEGGVSEARMESGRGLPSAEEEGEEGDGNGDMSGGDLALPPMGPTVCIFCDKRSQDFEANCAHMLREHGFFLPDVEYLTDPEGLVGYLEEKVKLGHICLYCNGKGKTFHSYRALQQHMIDRSHCKLLYEEGEDLHEYEAFYDFSSTYTEGEKRGLVERCAEEAGDTDEESVELSRKMTVNDLGELVLLDGRTVGNRQWNRYYRQRLKTPDESEFALAQRRATRLRLGALYDDEAKKGMSTGGAVALQRGQRRAYGGLPGVAGSKDIKMLRAHQRVEARERLKTGLRQNKLNKTFDRVADM